ncbi:hypothetical protein CYFUS_005485 [Cystobacter fuscus]|uniref:Putative auto-transporter adhesin head GIN domain-containing protein n=1 Tax=Cystobacter fuscus TaxID=43 RepID=A0A250J952_9BACT|nr:DUF2807 domain-containing protein [Cystobacter fuscus]ATB40037.1 hypothetical protein CYFUS_005485 [Cystobacter fuscus]
MSANKSSLAQATAAQTGSSGNLTTQERPVGPFSQVENDTLLPVFIVDGPQSVSVTVDANLQSKVLTTVKDGVLTITTSEFIAEVEDGSKVQISATALSAITVAGSGPVSATITPAANLALSVKSSGILSFNGTAQAVNAQVSGSGGMFLQGTTQSLDTQLRSSGYLDARLLPVSGAASLINEGSGPLTATANGTVSIELRSSGLITWFGSATVTKRVRTGSGLIIHLP